MRAVSYNSDQICVFSLEVSGGFFPFYFVFFRVLDPFHRIKANISSNLFSSFRLTIVLIENSCSVYSQYTSGKKFKKIKAAMGLLKNFSGCVLNSTVLTADNKNYSRVGKKKIISPFLEGLLRESLTLTLRPAMFRIEKLCQSWGV